MSQPSSMAISDETRLKPARKLPGRQLAGETVVVDPRARKVFLMNTVGGVVWSGVERGASVAEIVAEVVQRFRVTSEVARADVGRFVDELSTAGLVEVA
jgi:hypothetical protein